MQPLWFGLGFLGIYLPAALGLFTVTLDLFLVSNLKVAAKREFFVPASASTVGDLILIIIMVIAMARQ